MAWTDQCKIQCCTAVQGFLSRQPPNKKNVQAVLRQLSAESGIPRKTIQNWWYEWEDRKKVMKKGFTKTGKGDAKPADTTSKASVPVKNMAPTPPAVVEEIKEGEMCHRCGKNKVEKSNRQPDGSNTYLGPGSKYFGLCTACRKEKTRRVNHGEVKVVCPKCNHNFYHKTRGAK